MVAMANKRDLISDNRRYGFPISGRVPERAANKVRSEALKAGISMSKMISLIVSKWANGEDAKSDVDDKVVVDAFNKEKEEFKAQREGLMDEIKSLRKKCKKQANIVSKWEEFCESESDRINRVWKDSVTETLLEISSTREEQQMFSEKFTSIFSSVYKKNNK